jgi:hypothetical protein
MGCDLYLDTDPPSARGIGFTASDGRFLRDLISLGWADVLESFVPLDLSFLRYYASELADDEELIEEYGEEEAPRIAAEHRERCEFAGTRPSDADAGARRVRLMIW